MPRKYWLLLFAAAAVFLFAGNGSLLITDSVESNYALTAKEMVLSGDWLSPQIYGHYWYDKPIFFYWLTALAYKMFGFTEFAEQCRIFSDQQVGDYRCRIVLFLQCDIAVFLSWLSRRQGSLLVYYVCQRRLCCFDQGTDWRAAAGIDYYVIPVVAA